MELLKSQRNDLFQELVKAGLQPSDFTEGIDGGWYVIQLRQDSRISFEMHFNSKEDLYTISKLPGRGNTPHLSMRVSAKLWSDDTVGCIRWFRDWVIDVKREVDAPDLWLESTKALQFFTSVDALVADRFTIAELGAVQGQLRILGQSFGTSELPDVAKQRLAELAQTAMLKAETLTKKDWQYWIQGAFSSTVTSLELTEAQIQEVVALIRLAFGGLFLQA